MTAPNNNVRREDADIGGIIDHHCQLLTITVHTFFFIIQYQTDNAVCPSLSTLNNTSNYIMQLNM